MKSTTKRIIERTLTPTVLRSLPNGIRDQIVENKVLRNISIYTLVAGDVAAVNIGLTNVDYVVIAKPIGSSGYGNLTSEFWAILGTIPEKHITNADLAANIGYFSPLFGTQAFVYFVAKGAYADLAAAKAALTGTVIYYQLVTPIYEPYNGFPSSI